MTLVAVTAGIVILICGFCTLAEAALFSVSPSRVEVMRSSGLRTGVLLASLRGKINEPITALLTLSTLANTAGAAFVGALFATQHGSRGLPLFSVLFSVAYLLFAELIPKTLGVTFAHVLAPALSPAVLFLVWVFRPIVWLGRILTSAFTQSGKPRRTVSPSEITALARLAFREGTLNPLERDVISRILGLRHRRVADAMTPRSVVEKVGRDVTVKKAMDFIGTWHTRIPVHGPNPDRIEGLLFRRDVVQAAADDRMEIPMESLMRPAYFVEAEARLDTVLNRFLSQRAHMLVVADAKGVFQGVLTLEDILEEMIGREIVDEKDRFVDMQEVARQRAAEKPSGKNPS